MHKVLSRTGYTDAQLNLLRKELDYERRRVARSLGEGETSDEYVAILNAIDRIDKREFGNCVSCEKPITFGRLTVLPATEYCVDCSR